MSEKTLILHPFLKNEGDGDIAAQSRLEEACGLAAAIYLEVVEKLIVPLRAIRSATYLGTGKIAELSEHIQQLNIGLVIVDCSLSPIQQRNLEKELNCKVIDRTALILEIFGERAQTREGVLQVELAALDYQKSRLVRSWTHLERQKGGHGFTGGPGERQIELDRRMINDRIAKLKKQLEKVKKTRGLHRKSRQKVPYPIVALVGYTNAGKSTLFNRLTGAEVFAEDLLFATLDPTMRMLTLPSGNKVILSDTVGFISDLPTELIASFQATLEEVVEAELILHIRDASSPDCDKNYEDVLKILNNLVSEEKLQDATFDIFNKTDLADLTTSHNMGIPISALDGMGCDKLLIEIDNFISRNDRQVEFTLNASEGKLIAWLYEHGENVKQHEEEGAIKITATLSNKNISRFEKMN